PTTRSTWPASRAWSSAWPTGPGSSSWPTSRTSGAACRTSSTRRKSSPWPRWISRQGAEERARRYARASPLVPKGTRGRRTGPLLKLPFQTRRDAGNAWRQDGDRRIEGRDVVPRLADGQAARRMADVQLRVGVEHVVDVEDQPQVCPARHLEPLLDAQIELLDRVLTVGCQRLGAEVLRTV